MKRKRRSAQDGAKVAEVAEDDMDLDEIVISSPTVKSLKPVSQRTNSSRKTSGLLTPDTASKPSVEIETDQESVLPNTEVKRKRTRELRYITTPGPAYPRSAYQGWDVASTAVSEAEAIEQLLQAHQNAYSTSDQRPEYTYFRLDDFSIYLPSSSTGHSNEMVSLDRLSQDRFPEFCLEGQLSVDGVQAKDNQRFFVTDVHFKILTVDGYGEPDAALSEHLCVQSKQASRKDVWYKLGTPSSVYERFYYPFLWLAQFAKHFVDYLLDHREVDLIHFKNRFYVWLLEWRQTNEFLRPWISTAQLTDFRTTVAAHIRFLYKECYSLDDGDSGLLEHPLWKETIFLTAIPEELNVERHTVVTPYAYGCFQDMYFGEHLRPLKIHGSVHMGAVQHRKALLRLTPLQPTQRSKQSVFTAADLPTNPSHAPIDVSAGVVVSVRPDTDSTWGRQATGVWLAYVQAVRKIADRTLLDVLWLYEAKDTTLGKAFYAFPNELFLSDNCSCGTSALDIDCVIAIASVAWYATNPPLDKLFVRQKFRTVHEQDTYDFSALCEDDMKCQCHQKTTIFEESCSKYAVGDTVLVREWSKDIGEDRLQPAQIVRFDHTKSRIVLRRFLRLCELWLPDGDSCDSPRPNELVGTSEIFEKPSDFVIRKCHVRCFSSTDVQSGNIPAPYDRDGAGDFFYLVQEAGQAAILHRESDIEFGEGETESGPLRIRALESENLDLRRSVWRDHRADSAELQPGTEGDQQHQQRRYEDSDSINLPPIAQGWDPRKAFSKPKLTGLGIFCGGGTFDRGIEEGGAVEFRYAVDWATPALHSYKANASPDVKFFLGSVDDYLARAISGSTSDNIARPGNIEFIGAGSPCPGFSKLQNNKLSEESKKNASMVASVVSFVDFYVPEYFVLENVVTMTNGLGPNKDENVFSQVVAALVGLGYQVQQFLMDAWSYGSSQQRSRVFIVASAPGLAPLKPPPHSHAHPSGYSSRALGTSSNGLKFGSRRDEYTAFQHVSAAQSVADLPDISDSQVQLCPTHPDHRTAICESTKGRTRMAVVPTRPRGMGLMQAKTIQRGPLPQLITGEPLQHCNNVNRIRSLPHSKMFARVYPDLLFPTIVTRLAVGDGINGRVVHWDQHRTLTVMEARRAQGYLDHEVLVGTAVEQLKIVGNSVDRKVALVLGLALRESWIESPVRPGYQAIELNTDDQDTLVKSEEDRDEQEDGDEDDYEIDNRTAKIALNLSPGQFSDIAIDDIKAIRRLLEANPDGH